VGSNPTPSATIFTDQRQWRFSSSLTRLVYRRRAAEPRTASLN